MKRQGIGTRCIVGLLSLGVVTVYGGEIHDAVKANRIGEIKATIAKSPSVVNEQDDKGSTPLAYAVKYGTLETAGLLLEHGGDPTVKNSSGYSAIYYSQSYAPKRAFLSVLLCDGKYVNDQDKRGKSLLYTATANGWTECIETLLKNGADLGVQADDGDAPIHAACKRREAGTLSRLLEEAPNVNLPGRNGETALHLACRLGRIDMVKMLIVHDADPNVRSATRFGEGSLHYCGKYLLTNSAALTRMLLGAGGKPNLTDKQGKTALHHAAMTGNTATARELISADADLTVRDTRNRQTPLHVAASAQDDGSADIVAILLAAGAAPGEKAKGGWTPLLYAAARGNTESVRCLLENKADLNVADDSHGWTALHAASRSGQVEMVKLLLESGADPAQEDKSGHSPIQLAKARNMEAVVEVLGGLTTSEERGDMGK